jgi:hypothetical protein
MGMNRHRLWQYLGALAAIWAILIAVSSPPPISAKAPADLPPRPTPKPTASQGEHSDQLTGAYIELYMHPLRADLWTGVQWQGSQGDWYDVEGWQGTLNVPDCVRWYVAPMHFGAGPFRWVVSTSKGGEVLALGDPFDLPSHIGEVLKVIISLS